MKTPLTAAGAAVLLCAFILIPPAGAIPTNFGGGGFINPAGMRLEDFAAVPKTWESGAKLPGTWEMWHDDSVTDSGIELLRLKMPALVFGVPAAAVIVHRRDMQIEKFQIVFQPDKKTGDLDTLSRRLRTNASTWGDAGEGNSVTNGSAKYVIETDAAENRSVITITKLPNAVAAAATTP